MRPYLTSTMSGERYPFERIEEFTAGAESLEVAIPDIEKARVGRGRHLWERFSAFLPFSQMDADLSLGEGNTALVRAGEELRRFTGVENLFFKNETQNPTWSFKDRGSLACSFMARQMGEDVMATISTGNMGNSVAAYAAKAGARAIIFVPPYTPEEKIMAMAIHGAYVVKVEASDYSEMKGAVLASAASLGLRIVSGNGPVRVEGYKMEAFEMWEQMDGAVPDFIAVPTSACGHIRGIFKGYRELRQAGITGTVPRMIVVQARNNSPVVTAIRQGVRHVIPFRGFTTVAEAITSGNPPGGDEIIGKALEQGWPAEDVTEEEILDSQRRLARSGYFVEPASATTLRAVKRLRDEGKIGDGATVVIMLTGAGLKDLTVLRHHRIQVTETPVDGFAGHVRKILRR